MILLLHTVLGVAGMLYKMITYFLQGSPGLLVMNNLWNKQYLFAIVCQRNNIETQHLYRPDPSMEPMVG